MMTILLLKKAHKNWTKTNSISDKEREQDILDMLKIVKFSCVELRNKLYADLDVVRERMAN